MEEERGLGEIEKREIERKKIYREKEIEIVSYQSDHVIYLAVKSQDVGPNCFYSCFLQSGSVACTPEKTINLYG